MTKRVLKLAAMGLAALISGTMPHMAAAAEGFRLNVAGTEDGGQIDSRHAAKGGPRNCDGENISPMLSWENVPENTASFAILLHDQTGNHGLGVTHWIGYGIPGDRSELPEGALNVEGGEAYVGGTNRIGKPTWFGMCPDVGDVAHHYVFTLIATDLAPDALAPGLDRDGLIAALEGHTIGSTGYVVRYAR